LGGRIPWRFAGMPPGAQLCKGDSAIVSDGDMAEWCGAECIIGRILIQNCFMVGQNAP